VAGPGPLPPAQRGIADEIIPDLCHQRKNLLVVELPGPRINAIPPGPVLPQEETVPARHPREEGAELTRILT
jgi:hypothetical protein